MRKQVISRGPNIVCAHGEMAGVREADVCICVQTVPRPVPVPYRFPRPWVQTAVPIKEVTLVHPPPVVCDIRCDVLAFGFTRWALVACTGNLALRHGNLVTCVAVRVVNIANRRQKNE